MPIFFIYFNRLGMYHQPWVREVYSLNRVWTKKGLRTGGEALRSWCCAERPWTNRTHVELQTVTRGTRGKAVDSVILLRNHRIARHKRVRDGPEQVLTATSASPFETEVLSATWTATSEGITPGKSRAATMRPGPTRPRLQRFERTVAADHWPNSAQKHQ